MARRIENKVAGEHVTKVHPTHDLALLWKDALLPPLSREDQHRLLIAKRLLVWAGRYAAPKKDEHFATERLAMDGLEDRKNVGGLKLTRPRSFRWDDVDRIYQIALASFCEITSRS
jgi:hypothetical protein